MTRVSKAPSITDDLTPDILKEQRAQHTLQINRESKRYIRISHRYAEQCESSVEYFENRRKVWGMK